jgi:hypothetical protein
MLPNSAEKTSNEVMDMAGDSGSSGILGVIVGALLVLGLAYFFLGERVGLRSPGPDTIKIETPSTK